MDSTVSTPSISSQQDLPVIVSTTTTTTTTTTEKAVDNASILEASNSVKPYSDPGWRRGAMTAELPLLTSASFGVDSKPPPFVLFPE
ncbi:unnamed protein product [Penicillium manginii]